MQPLSSNIYQQLRQRNVFSTGFADVSQAYQKLLRQCKELKVSVCITPQITPYPWPLFRHYRGGGGC